MPDTYASTTCPERTGPVWVRGNIPGGDGEPCGCVYPANHPWEHLCNCGTRWMKATQDA